MIPLWLISTGLTALGSLFGKGKRRKDMEKEEELGTKIYHNCDYRNKNGSNKLKEPSKQCIFGGTNQRK